MDNPILAYMQSQIGQTVTESPSPVSLWLKGVWKTVEENKLAMDFIIRPEMANPMGTAHGGILATIIDDLIGATVFSLNLEYVFTTVNLNVDYLTTISVGETLTATAVVIRQGKNLIHLECRLTAENGRLVAKGTSNMCKTSIKL